MADAKKRKWLLPAVIAIALLLLAAVFLLWKCRPSEPAGATASPNPSATPAPSAAHAVYVPGEYPEGVSFAEVVTEAGLSDEERYAAYDHDNDPAHPVLDVKVKLSISNLGSRPGAPRPQDIALEYPAHTLPPAATAEPTPTPTPSPTPSVTLKPGGINPGLKPGTDLPDIELPELYIPDPNVPSPQYAGERYTLAWEYTAGRKAVFTVSLSLDGGKAFTELATGIEGKSYELTFPGTPAEHCVLRVTALVEGRVYKTADTGEFVLASVEPAPTPISGYVDSQVQYVDMPGLRLSNESGLPVWFKAESSAENADKLIWQLSKVPFWGTKESFGSEAGIVASGEVEKAGGEFSIDLAALCEELAKPDSERGADKPFLAKRSVYEFYLRVVAMDANGECIGDPGRGLQFSYGEPDVVADLNSTSLAESSNIQILLDRPDPDKPYSYKWQRINPGVLNIDLSNESDRVLFGCGGDPEASEIIRKAVRVELQVATSPFTNASALGTAQPDGLVYSYLDTAPDISQSKEGYDYLTPYFHGIEYKQFVLSKEELDAMGGIYYYVRGVFYVPDSENPSVLRPCPSETLTIACRAASAKNNEVRQITVKSDIPYVQFLGYVPVQWQDPNYDEYFEVTRHIEAEEMNFTIRNTVTGDFLLPYKEHIAKYGWTREQYQAKLDEMLPQYASFRYVKSEPGFWDEFFGLLKAIYDGVSQAYANAKAAAISFVADNIPLIGDEARGYLKQAMTFAVDYYLASIGIPPSLPNSDQLAEEGMEYIVKVAIDEALQSAGVSADDPAAAEITEEVSKQASDELSDELEKAVLAQQQNPFHADFLRISTAKLYRPAYVDVYVKNYSKTRMTRAGEVGFSSGNNFDVYKTRYVHVPPLKPGESLKIRIYLDHLRNQYDGYNQYFDKKYYGKGDKPYMMHVRACFDLPDVRQAAKEQGIAPAPLPYVTEYVYDHHSYEYEREFVPADSIWEADPSADPSGFMD